MRCRVLQFAPFYYRQDLFANFMTVSVFGINHVSAPVAVRERLAFGPDIVVPALQDLTRDLAMPEAVILSTCNRVELYLAGDHPQQAVAAWLQKNRHVSADDLQRCLYVYQENDAIRHLMRVACGLDSMVLGEPQILGQLKDAFATAQNAGTVGFELSKLFQQSFTVAKQVRTDTAIGQSAVSVAFAAVQLAKRIFTDLADTTSLFIGAGETIQLAAQHLTQQGARDIIVANRTVARAEELACLYQGEAISLSEIPDVLHRADIVISSTASPLPIIGKGVVERAIKARRHKPMFMVDLAVPRDIEAEVAQLDDIFLYSVDDLNGVVQENLKSRQEAAREAERIIADQVEQFLAWQRERRAASTIKDLREQWRALQDAELQWALQKLAAGESAEDVLRQFSHRLGNKFLHAPTERLRSAASNGEQHTLESVRSVFDLDRSTES